ncbi:MAG: asparagine synthase (glutamine-hydrolyzing) [Gammaproteobacteria bacterium]|nr:asparagine synthase (glutamine-hydrolyzing) [Gammaproteobacteria bacterium]
MCGLSGFLGGSALSNAAASELLLNRMAIKLAHRGPDDSGCWFDNDQRIGLVHRRLAILDLSSTGHQPMQSASGRFVVVFNGEIYNHKLLRLSLSGVNAAPSWKGGSDTETLLACFDAWGVSGTLARVEGMFAFALWDRKANTLFLARDRLGEKPLYYGWQGDTFLFGSELKTLKAHPSFAADIDRGSLSLYMRHNCVPSPYSIYKGISKLPPGYLLSVSLEDQEPQLSAYWSGAEAAMAGLANRFSGDEKQAVDALEGILTKSISKQMIADVPLGAFLSGGVDSSTVVALMQAESSRPVNTFTIGFTNGGYDEAAHAKAVARHLGTDHVELYVSSEQARAVIPSLHTVYDEPFSDSSQIPTLLVSQLAKNHVSVALSGDGGDELFCGYNRYRAAANIWRYLAWTPLAIRKLAAMGITSISPSVWTSLAEALSAVIPRSVQMVRMGDKLHKAAGVISSQSIESLYFGLVSHWQDPASVVIGGRALPTLLAGNEQPAGGLSGVQRMMLLDMLTYLPDDILTKVDRAAMAVSLEARVPLLDHKVVEFAWSLPQEMKLRNSQTKWVLREVLYRHVPKELIERPKMGFGVPLGDWLRGPLREWAEELLAEQRLREEGYFHPQPIRKKWAEHLAGQRNWQHHLWDVLMFQAWLESDA